MCGRLALHTIPSQFASLFPRLDFSDVKLGYNVCPTQPLLALRPSKTGSNLELTNLRWGLVPAWADDISVGCEYDQRSLRNGGSKTFVSLGLSFAALRNSGQRVLRMEKSIAAQQTALLHSSSRRATNVFRRSLGDLAGPRK